MAEDIEDIRLVEHAFGVLMEHLIPQYLQTSPRRSVDDVDRTGCSDRGCHVLERTPDGQVVEAVAVEVARRQRSREVVANLGRLENPLRVLMPHLIPEASQSHTGAPVEDVDGAGPGLRGSHILEGDT